MMGVWLVGQCSTTLNFGFKILGKSRSADILKIDSSGSRGGAPSLFNNSVSKAISAPCYHAMSHKTYCIDARLYDAWFVLNLWQVLANVLCNDIYHWLVALSIPRIWVAVPWWRLSPRSNLGIACRVITKDGKCIFCATRLYCKNYKF